jgi:acyl carrier protein
VTSDAAAAGRIRDFVRSRFPLAREMDVADDASLLDAGIVDSLGVLDLVTFLEDAFGVKVEDEELSPENFESIVALVRFVGAKR